MSCVFFWFTTRGNSRQDHKFYSKLEQILSSSAPSTAPDVSYDVEEVVDEDESQDGDEDLQFVGQTGQPEIGKC